MTKTETQEAALKSYMHRKILSTLWKHQQERFGREKTSKRWTFAVGRFHPDALGFELAIKDLALEGMVFFNPETSQFGLTDRGIEFCKENEDKLDMEEVFTF